MHLLHHVLKSIFLKTAFVVWMSEKKARKVNLYSTTPWLIIALEVLQESVSLKEPVSKSVAKVSTGISK